MDGKGSLKEITIEATVMGPCKFCGLGAEWWGQQPCRNGHGHEATFTRPLGVVSSWHRNRLVRGWRRLKGNGKVDYEG